MTYERLPYEDADTVEHMQHDAEEAVSKMRLPEQVSVASALDAAGELAADAVKTVRTTVFTVSDAAAKLAGRLLPF